MDNFFNNNTEAWTKPDELTIVAVDGQTNGSRKKMLTEVSLRIQVASDAHARSASKFLR